MTLTELIDCIELKGYSFHGDRTFSSFPFPVADREVIAAPMVLIPQEPLVQSDCQMVQCWLRERTDLEGYARVEGSAALNTGVMVHLQFVKKVQQDDGS